VTGIGAWSDDDIKQTLRTGIRPNGVPLAGVMPSGFYGIITDGDMNAIVAYLRSLQPISNKEPDPVYRTAALRETFPGAEQPLENGGGDSKLLPRDYRSLHGTWCGWVGVFWSVGQVGGSEYHWKGLRKWSDAEIKRAITQGISQDGSKLKPPMGYAYYARMTDADLDTMVARLRTLPPKE
jgi:hypothetical protein